LHREGVIILRFGFATCPGLFYDTPAQDGILSRMRIPGGIIDSKQCQAIADIADQYGGGYIDVTNRANIQIREIRTGINAVVLQRLQAMGIGSRNWAVDHIRNIMTSPTAGIDSQEIIDTRPLVQAWNNYIQEHAELSELSAKFSVCFDGGGLVSVCDRLNDIMLAAVLLEDKVYFRLYLSVGAKGKPPIDMEILLSPEKCIPVLAALAAVYLTHSDTSSKRKPRLREVVNNVGCENYLQQVAQRLSFPLCHSHVTPVLKENNYRHIGIHPQRQTDFFYMGVVLPLGRLETQQLRGLADLAEKYGSGILRLTPWQNILLTDIPQQWVMDIKREIVNLGLDFSATNLKSALVACSGKKGCAAAATDTKGDALALAKYLETAIKLNRPVNIHFSGCEKSCAQHKNSDITLVGAILESDHQTVETYHIYIGDSLRGEAIGDSNQKFGRAIYQHVTVTELPVLIRQMLQVYKTRCLSPDESFSKFVNRHEIAQLKKLFA
jgi:ferredoxin-nitrite reductase